MAKEQEKFPWLGVLTNACVLSVNAFSLFQCFPYAGKMIVFFGKAKTKDEAGYYAGFLGSGFMIGRSLTSLFWGVFADLLGRKKVIVVGCLAMIVFQLMFGLSQTFETALASRILLGIFNGLVATAKTIASEIVPTHRRDWQALSMSTLSAGVSVASLMGPALGGWASEPATQYPGSIFDTPFLRAYPFFLPNLFGALFAFFAMVMTLVYLPETLVKKEVGEDITVLAQPPSFRTIFMRQSGRSFGLLKQKNVRHAVLWYACQGFTSIYLYEIFPLWLLASKHAGGVELSLGSIGSVQSITGLICLCYQACLFPKIASIVPPIQLWVRSGYILAPFVVLMPFLTAFSMSQVMILIVVTMLRSFQVMLDMTMFTCSFLIINNSARLSTRGAANGLAMSIASIAKSIGPIVGAVLFAWGSTNGMHFPFGHHFSFFVCAAFYCIQSFGMNRFMPPGINRMKGSIELVNISSDSEEKIERRSDSSDFLSDEGNGEDDNEINLVFADEEKPQLPEEKLDPTSAPLCWVWL